jgi:hypothetical protein
LTVDAENDRSAHLQVHVRGPAIDSRLQYTMKYFHIRQSTELGRGTKDENATGSCATVGTHSMGILHVAASEVLLADEFIIFDGRQRLLATALGLKAAPS